MSGSTSITRTLEYCRFSAEGPSVAFSPNPFVPDQEQRFHAGEHDRLTPVSERLGGLVDACLADVAKTHPELHVVQFAPKVESVRHWDSYALSAWQSGTRRLMLTYEAPEQFDGAAESTALRIEICLSAPITMQELFRLDLMLMKAVTPPGMPTGRFVPWGERHLSFKVPGGEMNPYHSGRQHELAHAHAQVFYRGFEPEAPASLHRLLDGVVASTGDMTGADGRFVWCEIDQEEIGRVTVSLGGIAERSALEAGAAIHRSVESVLGPMPLLGMLEPDRPHWFYRTFNEPPSRLVPEAALRALAAASRK